MTSIIPEAELDLFEADKVSLGVLSEHFVDYRPINTTDKSSFIQFNVQSAGKLNDKYINQN